MSGHGGNLHALAREAGRDPESILDFSANINPLGPPPWLRPVINRHISDLVNYPEPDASEFLDIAAAHYGLPVSRLVAGNGSSEILFALVRALRPARAVVPAPAYIDYAHACEVAGVPVTHLPLKAEEGFVPHLDDIRRLAPEDGLLFLGQPNNPTGVFVEPGPLREAIRACPHTTFVIDEAFADFCDRSVSLLPDLPDNAIVMRSLTKFYAVPGLRLGLGIASEAIARKIHEQIPPWSVNTFAQAIGMRALPDRDFADRTRALVRDLRDELTTALRELPELTVYDGCANFVFLRFERDDLDAHALARRLLLEHGLAIRVCDNYAGLDARYFRVAVRTRDDNLRLLKGLKEILGRGAGEAESREVEEAERRGVNDTARSAASPTRRQRARSIMFQGTGSNAGKSMLAAALCRILLQDGYDVAPFKAQNMALNSFVTPGGGEIGRAQALQAQACRLAPDVRMNPVLLKPTGETGSQVIVLGKAQGTFRVREYDARKDEIFRTVQQAYDELAAAHEVIVLEGAGSPGEVNLKARDIVNMRMARYAQSPVLLVGDIDRGGVYAGFVGTLDVLEEWERRLVAGFVVNKFRGDASLLAPAHDYVLEYTGLPVLGVVPHAGAHGLPEEDSVTFKEIRNAAVAESDMLDIALIDLPRISNFTDYDPLRLELDVRLRVVRSARDLGSPDAVLLPGSKNVTADLAWLRAQGLADALQDLAAHGASELVGICGGLQMLGALILDPTGAESEQAHSEGLGLLPISTTFAAEKTLTQCAARHVVSGHVLSGYEIHHGRTDFGPARRAIERADGEALGVERDDGRVWGTYLHGLFDADEFRRWWLDRLRTRKNLAPVGRVVATYDIDAALDRWADLVREHMDLPAVYRILGLA